VISYHTMSDCKDRGLDHRDRPLLPSSRRHHQTVGLTSARTDIGCWRPISRRKSRTRQMKPRIARRFVSRCNRKKG